MKLSNGDQTTLKSSELIGNTGKINPIFFQYVSREQLVDHFKNQDLITLKKISTTIGCGKGKIPIKKHQQSSININE